MGEAMKMWIDELDLLHTEGRLDSAARRAAVAVLKVPIVALFAALEDAVAAARRDAFTGGIADAGFTDARIADGAIACRANARVARYALKDREIAARLLTAFIFVLAVCVARAGRRHAEGANTASTISAMRTIFCWALRTEASPRLTALRTIAHNSIVTIESALAANRLARPF